MYSCEQSNVRLQLDGQALEEHDYGGAHACASPAAEALGAGAVVDAASRVYRHKCDHEQAKSATKLLAAGKDTRNPCS